MTPETSIILKSRNAFMILHATSPEKLEEAAREYLMERGWWVQKPREWETLAVFCKRIGITSKILATRFRQSTCPPVDVMKSRASGRRTHVAATPVFEEFCRNGRYVSSRKDAKVAKGEG
jgi:hypothetical protein